MAQKKKTQNTVVKSVKMFKALARLLQEEAKRKRMSFHANMIDKLSKFR